jgi:hypothetical protein
MRAQQRRDARAKLAKERRIAKHRRDRHGECFGEAGEGSGLGPDQIVERRHRSHAFGGNASQDAAMERGGRVFAEIEAGGGEHGIQQSRDCSVHGTGAQRYSQTRRSERN